MYRLIGTDGKTYGPVNLEQVRQWIVQGRADSRTAVFVDGTSDWTFLGLLPEFAGHFPVTPPLIAPVKTGSPTAVKTNGFATAGFVCGLFSCLCCCGCPFNLFGLIFSLVALAQIGAAAEPQEGRGLAIAGLICSAVSLLLGFGLGLLQLALAPANLSWHLGSF